MARYSPARVVFTSAIVFLATSPLLGQVDHRINQGNMAAGRALDANFAVGQGPRIPNQTRYVPGRWAEAVVTGNVTGLGRLHVPASALGTNQFRLSLPSAGLSDFIGRSVNLSSIRQNMPPRPTFYYGASETIADVGQITRGLNAPGSSRLISPYTPPSAVTLSNTTRFVMDPVRPIDMRASLDAPLPTQGMTQRHLYSATEQGALMNTLQPFSTATDSTLFGPRFPARSRTPAPISNDRILDSTLDQILADRRKGETYTPPDRISEQIGPESAVSDDMADNRLGGRLGDRPGDRSGGRLGGQETDEASRFNLQPDGTRVAGVQPPAVGEQGIRHRPLTDADRVQPPQGLGGDFFTDLRGAVSAAQHLRVTNFGYELVEGAVGRRSPAESPTEPATPSGISAAASDGNQAPDKLTPPSQRILQRRPTESMAQLATAARWAETRLQEPLTSFVGKHKTRLNAYLAAGEQSLKSGDYYNAALQFDLACTVDSQNPLPWLARGHALVAAGDYISAVVCLQRGIERFPQIAAFRLDLPAIADQHDIFDVRRADLEDQLAIGEHYELRFLLGYLELYSGLPESGLRNLRRAARGAPQDSAIAIFPDLVLGNRELPRTRP